MYFIYELVDPRTELTNYIGITNNPNARQQQHLESKDSNHQKQEWIQQLVAEGLRPKMKILEIVDDKKHALERERYWILHYLDLQVPLLNIQKPALCPSKLLPQQTTRTEQGGTATPPRKPAPSSLRQRKIAFLQQFRDEGRLIAEAEAAEMLQISVIELRTLAKERGIFCMRPGGYYTCNGVMHPLTSSHFTLRDIETLKLEI